MNYKLVLQTRIDGRLIKKTIQLRQETIEEFVKKSNYQAFYVYPLKPYIVHYQEV